ncbi:MAG TPA: PKD domain-containing protein [Ferruginibacter sp.]|nr:PKD domain-containing protein [Ferruginibacter sp.]HRO17074.1 PKD domain-containing protein [Ferruginibacter sp.]HRQ20151.1 PKD domain-containing protein [Ferruginibacter sp.]
MALRNLAKTGVLVIVFVFAKLASNAQLRADFSSSTVAGCAPIIVQFQDLSTGNPQFWRWDLGNGTISFLQNPSVTYFNPGQYTVRLFVQGDDGQDSIVRTQYITVHALPSINFTANTTTGCYPLPVQFTDATQPGSGNITNWIWDFGDGISDDQPNPVHTYTGQGIYNVSLLVTNSFGCSNTITRPQYINVSTGVNAGFTHSDPTSCFAPSGINFQNNSTGTGTLTYVWDFGDGQTSTAENPSHTYTTNGSYTVKLFVRNSSGCADSLVMNNNIVIGHLQSGFSFPATICAGSPAAFTNTTTPVGADASWDFGDGTTSTQNNPSKTYTIPGTYTVRLIVSSGGCSDTLSQNITVLPKPQASFTAAPVSSCSVPLTVNFTNTSAQALSYLWNFGDGNTSTAVNPSHTYTTEGTYTVTLTATNANGCTDRVTQQELINISLPSASILDLPQEGCAPLTWSFTSEVNATDPVTSYLWNFGDGTTSTDETPTHTFAAGMHDISLIITTASGCKDTVIVPQGIRAGDRPITGFTATPRVTCAWQAILFTDTTIGNVDRWLWEFGDGATSVLQNPEHKYRDTGYFDVTLIVWNNGCSDTLKFEDYIRIEPPIARMITSATCAAPFTRNFINRSVGAETVLWDFADGNTSTQLSPTHTYAAAGTYRVMLVAYNSITGCSDTAYRTVNVYDEKAQFSTPDTNVCRKVAIPFTSTSNPQFVSSYQWDFGDGGLGTGRTVHHTYHQNGVYTVRLIITLGDGCKDTLIKSNYIHVSGPTAAFEPDVPGTCSMAPIVFNDQSTSDGTDPIVSWTWNYGDGVIETLTTAPFIHTYNSPGNYTVELTVTDSEGCTDKAVTTTPVTVSRPRAAFNSPDSLTCPERTVRFMSNSSGPSLRFEWDFGDGNTSTLRNPIHSYLTDGTFDVKLVVTDRYGCTDSITKPSYIRIVTPQADFMASDTIGTCPPLVVSFTNQSQNYTRWSWDFGDNTSSNALNPSHFYAIPGVYNAVLTVTGPGGCTSTKVQPIHVKGPQGTFVYDKTTGCDPLTVTFTATTLDRVSFVWDFNDGNTMSTVDSVVTHTYTRPGFYVPKMILRDAGGCIIPITGPDTIWVKGVDASFTQNIFAVCDSGSVQFNNTSVASEPITNYTWNFGDGQAAASEHPQHVFNTPGMFTVQLNVTTQSGCTASAQSTVPVTVAVTPRPVITQSENGCTPLTASFGASLEIPDTTAITWLWNFGNGSTATQTNVTGIDYTQSGTYTVRLAATNVHGCTGNTTSNISAYAIPVVSAGAGSIVCFGTPKQLNATGASTYVWTPATDLSCTDCPDPLVSPAAAVTYTVVGTSAEGCVDSAQISLEVAYPFTMEYSRRDSICEGGSERIFASGAHSYTWYPSTGLSNPNVANPIASPVATTMYMVVGRDDKNCFTDTAYVPMIVFPKPRVFAGNDRTVNVGQIIDLIPEISSDVTEVIWSPTGSIFRSDYPSITVRPRETTTYRVEVKNPGGCMASDDLTVYVICNGGNVYIPNTFSPNSDGNNDIFYPRGTGLFRIKSAKIFNRWGEIVYQRNDFMANDASAGWDGTYKGQKLTPDVFVYVIEILCDNNQLLPFKGNVTLIR